MDLSVTVAGVKFRNPVLSGASELAQDEKGVRRLIKAGVGGITTKSYSSMKVITRRPRPYQFPLSYTPKFELKDAGAFYTLACPHPEDIEKTITKDIPGMAKACHENEVPLIVSIIGLIEDEKTVDSDWLKLGKRFQDGGADMLELNLSCPQAKKPIEKNPSMSFDLVHEVSQGLSIPVGVKISPEMGPLEDLSKGWVDAGAKFISAHNAPDGIVIDVDAEEPYAAPGIGGYIVGRPFLPMSLSRCIQIKKAVDVEVIGIGGIYSGYDALQYILSGCSTVLLCTSVYMEGTRVIKRSIRDLKNWMEEKGYTRIDDFKGKALKKIIPTGELKTREIAPHVVPPECPYVPLIDVEKCNLCGDCVRSCDSEVYSVNKEKKEIEINENLCWSCGLCVGICKHNAIVLVDRKDKEKVIWDGHGMAKSFRKIMEVYTETTQ